MTQPTTTGTLEHLDPHTLELELNVRTDAALDAEFVASIKEHGVLTPIAARRDPDGVVRVRAGQRRTLAAREAGLSTVPVYVRDLSAGDEKTQTGQRLAEQMVENIGRADLSGADYARGIQQMLDTGMSPTKVAKKLSVSKKVVEAAATVSESETACKALAGAALTIEQAAILAEFDTDPAATEYLLAAENAGQFDHRVAELREKAATAAAREVAAKPYREAGHQVLDRRPGWSESLSRYCETSVWAADGTRGVSAEAIAEHPQAWAVYLDEQPAYIDTRSDETVDEYDIDWDVEGDDGSAEAAEGLIHPRFIKETTSFEPLFYCVDPETAQVGTYAEVHGSGSGGGAASIGQESPAAKEAARRERRKVVLLNKLGLAAEEVRRAWIKDKLLSRKTAPKGSAIWLATNLAQYPDLVTNHRAEQVTRELLGLPEATRLSAAAAELPPTGDGRAVVMLLGMVLAAMETETPKDAWRHSGRVSADYLRFLADHGYALSEVEKVVTGELTGDQLYDQQTEQHDQGEPAQQGAA